MDSAEDNLMPKPPPAAGGPSSHFPNTHWTTVVATRDENLEEAKKAMEELCRIYRYPIYAFIRRSAKPEDADDLTQGFFAYLLKYETILEAKRGKGKFRNFLLSALKKYRANVHEHDNAIKRGRGKIVVPFDDLPAEDLFRHEPATLMTPEKLYERQCACALLARAMGQLESAYLQQGKGSRFAVLREALSGDGESYAEYATKLNSSEDAVKVAVHRLRKAVRNAIKAEIAQTVSSPAEIEDEIRHLFIALESP